MPIPALTLPSFRGSLKIVQGSYDTELEEFIDEFQDSLLRQWLGNVLYSDFDTNFADQKYQDLWSGSQYLDDSTGNFRYQTGMESVIVKLIFFEYHRTKYSATQVGPVASEYENGSKPSFGEYPDWPMRKYNDAVMSFEEIRRFYHNFRHRIVPINAITDLGGGVWEVATSSTTYLENGDTVSIAGRDYTISNVVADTSFEVSSEPSGSAFVYSAFPETNLLKTNVLLY